MEQAKVEQAKGKELPGSQEVLSATQIEVETDLLEEERDLRLVKDQVPGTTDVKQTTVELDRSEFELVFQGG